MYILLLPQPNLELYKKYLRMKESKNNKTYHNNLINICSKVNLIRVNQYKWCVHVYVCEKLCRNSNKIKF